MTLEDDLAEVRKAIKKDHEYAAADAITRLGTSRDDAALEMLLNAFEWARMRSCEPAKTALVASPHPDVSVRIEASLLELPDSELGQGLEELCLLDQYRVSGYAAAMLRRFGANGGKLRRLELPGCFGNLAPNTWNFDGGMDLPSLREVVLDGAATGDFFATLAHAWFLPQLTELSLASTYVFADRLDPLLSVDPLALERLSLRDCEGLRAELFEKVATSALVRNVKWLDVGGRTDLRGDTINRVSSQITDAMRAAGWPR
ncbi:hypothetical protein [Enhygromyxa salina]|uniref:hypothetical protein n=1 Tax=Enhygromyxa salina TaxID=215803 RepID=UPI0011B24F48|nr:hypothetical protein [Enhygromyxa salina]